MIVADGYEAMVEAADKQGDEDLSGRFQKKIMRNLRNLICGKTALNVAERWS